VWVAQPPDGRYYEVEHSRAYRDRLVLKLKGIEDGNEAARLRGHDVFVAREDAPRLPDGVHYVAELVGMLVVDERHGELGRVEGIVETGGVDLLRVRRSERDSSSASGDGDEEDAEELLIPLAREYVRSVDEDERRIHVRIPPGLRDLNRPGGSAG
jgi:16S rRNA processing protein RimM